MYCFPPVNKSSLITDTILDHGSTYAEDNVSSGNVILRMAHDALIEWARAHGRGHCRQKNSVTGVVNRGEKLKKGRDVEG
jgi:hypothetical protein